MRYRVCSPRSAGMLVLKLTVSLAASPVMLVITGVNASGLVGGWTGMLMLPLPVLLVGTVTRTLPLSVWLISWMVVFTAETTPLISCPATSAIGVDMASRAPSMKTTLQAVIALSKVAVPVIAFASVTTATTPLDRIPG